MQHELCLYHPEKGWLTSPALKQADLVMAFVSEAVAQKLDLFEICKAQYPKAQLVFVGSGGQIVNQHLYDDEVSLLALQSQKTQIHAHAVACNGFEESKEAGRKLGVSLQGDDLQHIVLFVDAQHVNTPRLIEGLYETLPETIGISGGLASDNAAFVKSRVGLNGPLREKQVVAVAFYGRHLHVYCTAESGWHEFGPTRVVTRADKHLLYDVDGERFWDLYRRYIEIDEDNANLASLTLYHPLMVKNKEKDGWSVRAVFGSQEDGGMIMATEIEAGQVIKLTHGNYQKILDGAEQAARTLKQQIAGRKAVVLTVSCVARRLLLGLRTEDELEAVKEALPDIDCMGFYSHGEIAYDEVIQLCDLHNQTMTMTAFVESE